MGSATSIPAAVPSVVSSTAAASTAIRGHTHHDQPLLARFDMSVTGSFLVILFTTLLGAFHLIPVYAHMMLVTVCTIYIGSRFALKCWKIEQSASGAPLTERNIDPSTGKESHRHVTGESMRTNDAMMFPVIGSCVLFSLYCVYKFLPKEYVNVVIKAYFFIFGAIVLAQKIAQVLTGTLPVPIVHTLLKGERYIPNPLWIFSKIETLLLPVLKLIPGLGYNTPAAAPAASSSSTATPAPVAADAPTDFWMSLSHLDLLSLVMSIIVSIIYIFTNSWICSNMFGISFSIQGIEMLSLGSYLNGCILLCGLFIYDIFWVFGTDVMVTVAKSFDAPIKLLFPQFGFVEGSGPSMLGLGDIVIPGIFIALLLRYDIWRQIQRVRAKLTTSGKVLTPDEEHNLECLYCHMLYHRATLNPIYFVSNLIAYFVGLSVTVGVMYWFKAAQPALLYLVPACLGTSLALALLRGDFKTLWKYTENEEETADAAAKKKDDDITVKTAKKEVKDTTSSSSSSSSANKSSPSSNKEDDDFVVLPDTKKEPEVTKRVTRKTSSKKKRSTRVE